MLSLEFELTKPGTPPPEQLTSSRGDAASLTLERFLPQDFAGAGCFNPNARPLQRVRFSLLCQGDLT
jgi:hypothetical protein